MPTIYLAGPISGLTFDQGASWRDYVEDAMPPGINVSSPLRNKEYLRSKGIINQAYPENPLSSSRGIMTRDRFDVINATVVLMNLLNSTKVSVGTMIEVGLCDLMRHPLVLVMEKTGNLHDHPMLREAAGYITDDLDEAINICISILTPYIYRGVDNQIPSNEKNMV